MRVIMKGGGNAVRDRLNGMDRHGPRSGTYISPPRTFLVVLLTVVKSVLILIFVAILCSTVVILLIVFVALL